MVVSRHRFLHGWRTLTNSFLAELDLDVDGHETREETCVSRWPLQGSASYSASTCENVVDDFLLDLVGIMRPPGEDGIGYSTDFPHDPDEFDFANDVLWGRELGAIVKQCKERHFEEFRTECHLQWQRFVNKCGIVLILLHALQTQELLDWTSDEFEEWTSNLKSELKSECLELFKRFENFEYWVRVFAWSRGIRDVQEPMMSSRYWLS